MGKFIVVVLDGFGIGAMADAAEARAGDEHSNTFLSILREQPDLKLPVSQILFPVVRRKDGTLQLLPGHKIGENAVIENSMITDGCRIDGTVKHSILFAGVRVEEGAKVEDAVIMGNAVIKAGAKVEHCIIAENAVIGEYALVGAMPTETEKGVATVGPGVVVGSRALIGPKAMVDKNVKDGDAQW